MSTDQWEYVLTCQSCGSEGSVSMWSDDWCRWGAHVHGFKGIVNVTGPKPERLRCDKCGGENPTITRVLDVEIG